MFLTFQNEMNFLHTHTVMVCVPVIIAPKKYHFALITDFAVKESDGAQKHISAPHHNVWGLNMEDLKARAAPVTAGIPLR